MFMNEIGSAAGAKPRGTLAWQPSMRRANMRKAGFHGHLKNDANPGIFLERKNRHQGG
jgi:hypothetical protein